MTDILYIDDISIANGDFSIGESTSQEVVSIITSYPGWWKEYPLVGCAAPSYLNSSDSENLRNSIQQQLLSDSKIMSSYTSSFVGSVLTINCNGISIELSN